MLPQPSHHISIWIKEIGFHVLLSKLHQGRSQATLSFYDCMRWNVISSRHIITVSWPQRRHAWGIECENISHSSPYRINHKMEIEAYFLHTRKKAEGRKYKTTIQWIIKVAAIRMKRVGKWMKREKDLFQSLFLFASLFNLKNDVEKMLRELNEMECSPHESALRMQGSSAC